MKQLLLALEPCKWDWALQMELTTSKTWTFLLLSVDHIGFNWGKLSWISFIFAFLIFTNIIVPFDTVDPILLKIIFLWLLQLYSFPTYWCIFLRVPLSSSEASESMYFWGGDQHLFFKLLHRWFFMNFRFENPYLHVLSSQIGQWFLSILILSFRLILHIFFFFSFFSFFFISFKKHLHVNYPVTSNSTYLSKINQLRKAWVAQQLSICLQLSVWSCGPGIKSHIRLPMGNLLLPLPLHLSLPLCVCVCVCVWLIKSLKKLFSSISSIHSLSPLFFSYFW